MTLELAKRVIEKIWAKYSLSVPFYKSLFSYEQPVLDHFALIDIPSQYSGRKYLSGLFKQLGFIVQGDDYLPDKKNDFLWMSANQHGETRSQYILPQAILADFRIKELSKNSQNILQKYMQQAQPFDQKTFNNLAKINMDEAASFFVDYLFQTPWHAPSLKDYELLKEENELLAWVLLMGRKINHFGIWLNYSNTRYLNLDHFHQLNRNLLLNKVEGIIKGSKQDGIEQSSTIGNKILMQLNDNNTLEVHDSFLEFVWRHPLNKTPKFWHDYYMGFIAKNANRVVESIFDKH